MRRGFTLIQISILLVVASLVLVAILPSSQANLTANNTTISRMNRVLNALRGYEATHAALPCPADASQPIGSTTYGVQNAGAGTTSNCVTGSPAGILADSTNKVAVGMVPVRSLGLSNDLAIDGYGRDFTYAVDTNATSCFAGTLPGQITVTDNGTPNSTIAVLVSHGADGHGAWIPRTGSTGAAVRLNVNSTDTNTLLNAHVNASFTAYTPLTNFVKALPTTTFDDLLLYKSNLWNFNTVPAATSVILPSITPPSNGSYYTGQVLTFTATFGGTLTVNTAGGTPSLKLTVPSSGGGSNVRAANYVSVSGNTMTFTYTVQSTDLAPNGITMSSPINLNGGTISVANASACLTFNTPNLSLVLLNPVTIFVTDQNGNRMEAFNSNAAFSFGIGAGYNGVGGSIGSSGTANGKFSPAGAQGVIADSSGNIYVGDSGNNRVQKFSSSGTYLSQLGACSSGTCSASTANGSFNTPNGLAIDASNNIYVAEQSNNRVQKFNSSGTWLMGFGAGYNGVAGAIGSSGSTSGKLNYPTDVAVDPSGNVWVADNGNNRVVEYNSSGTYVTQLGCGSGACGSGSGSGQFASTIYGVAADAGGNIYVTDWSNNRVEKFSNAGVYVSQLGCTSGQCSASAAAGAFNGVDVVYVDASGNIWVTDDNNARVEEFSSCGVYINSIGAGYNNVAGSEGTTGTASGQFNGPNYVGSTGLPGGGGACVTVVTPPANGAYTTGQVLTFSVKYNAVVTVTGTPQLVLTIGSNTRYATYVSGSGTNTITFSYTIQSSDSTTGTAVASSINLNGGSITSGGLSANNSFTPPAMGGISINATAFMLVSDASRVEQFDLLGNYITQFGGSGTGGNGKFNGGATGIGFDGGGNPWVADYGDNLVEKFNTSFIFQSQYGATGTSGNGNYNNINGVAIDSSGNIWAADGGNNRIQETSSSGTWMASLGGTTSACSSCLCTGASCPVNPSGGNGNGQFNGPAYIHFDSSGDLWVDDYYNNRLEEFSSSGNFIRAIGPFIPNCCTLSTVNDFALDSCSNLWIADYNGGSPAYIVETDYVGNFLNSFSFGSGTPRTISIDSNGNFYVSDYTNNVVNIYNSSGTLTSTFGSAGTGNGQFSAINDIELSGSSPTPLTRSSCPAVILAYAQPASGNYTTGGTLGFALTYDQAVTVTGTPAILVNIGGAVRSANYVSGSGTTTLTFQYTIVAADNDQTGITVNPSVTLNSSTITNNSLNAGTNFTTSGGPITVNKVGYSNFYIADTTNNEVRLVTSSSGNISTVAGTGTAGNTNDNNGSQATAARLNVDKGIALDSSGNIYIADTTGHTVLKVTATSGVISTIAGTGTSGSTNDNNGSLATAAQLNTPSALAVDGSGNVYIVDPGNFTVLKITAGTGVISVIAGTSGSSGTTNENNGSAATAALLAAPSGVAVDGSGNVYISDATNHVVLKITNSTGKIAYYAGTGANGTTNENNGSLATAAKLKSPSALALDSSGNLYIADNSINDVFKVNASTGVISVIAGNGSSGGYNGDNIQATNSKLNAPSGLAVDSTGNIYIADTNNNRIRVVNTYGTITTVAGNGTAGLTGNGAAATNAEINLPKGVATSR